MSTRPLWPVAMLVVLSVPALRALSPAWADGTSSAVRPRAGSALASGTIGSGDLHRVAVVGDVQIAPDGSRIAYSVQRHEGKGRPSSEIWIHRVRDHAALRLGSDRESASGPRWSPDSASLAFFGRRGDEYGVMVADADGGNLRFISAADGTNHPLPSAGERLTWSPDGTRIAFIAATPGPEADRANGDPMVITRYLYKPTASEGSTRFNDNRRTHIFVAEVSTGQVRQLTEGAFYEHSIDWSPDGAEIAFVSNREPDPDRFFNYDIFAVAVADRSVRRITSTKNAEYVPQWSPDGSTLAYLGTTRELTSSETTMEDTHVWVVARDGTRRREVGTLDNRQGALQWAPDGRSILTSVQARGSVGLHRVGLDGPSEAVLTDAGTLGAWSVARSGAMAASFSTPASPAELYLRSPGERGLGTKLTRLNDDWLATRRVAPVTPFTFTSFDGTQIEAFLTEPVARAAGATVPAIVSIHGGPHGQQGPAFNHKAQVYASQGWATLMVNYRGSTGYGQRLADAIFKDQNGGEAKDVVAGVDAALARFPWLDAQRLGIEGGSYGGQLTNWIITQTDRFKAAIPLAGISNLVSFNYMAYYHDYLAVEFGAFPNEQGLIDLLWERSPIRYAKQVKTPTLFIHGENDNDVPIAEAEQFFIALMDVGVETVMVRYPREGHGIREVGHSIDVIDRSITWYAAHFAGTGRKTVQTAKPGEAAR